MKNFWKFACIDIIEDVTFNASLERFYKFKIDGIVRENIQNSLDARNYDIDKPVKVTINLNEIEVGKLPGVREEIFDRIHSLKGANEYTEETIENMISVISKEKISVISFEDENTKGLKYTDGENDTWKTYAYKKGVHSIDSNKEIENNRGGSHGIGKIASNAASELFLVYFINCDEEGNKHIGGTVQLIEHEFEGKCYRSTGYFVDNFEKEIPFKNTYDGIFEKNSRGLKLVIPFYKEDFGDEKDVIKSVCKSFFLAILDEKLVVEVNGNCINKETIGRYIENEDYFSKNLGKRSTEMTPLYFNTLRNEEESELIIKDGGGKEYHFKLYFKYDESITKGRVAIIRSIGMKIEDFRIDNASTKPFNAVLIPKNSECDKFLKSLENESHTELSYKHFKVKDHEKNAKNFISNLNRKIKNIIDEHIKKNNETTGEMNVNDVIYEIENIFRENLKDKKSIINIGNSEITKRKPEKRKRDKENKNMDKEESLNRIRRERKPETLNENGERDKEEIYSVTPHFVKRAVILDQEVLEIDLSSTKEIKENQKVDLTMKIVDGVGLEYGDEFFIDENYSKIVDQFSKEVKIIKDNKIKDIEVKNKKVRIILDLKKSYNRALKFRYCLEV